MVKIFFTILISFNSLFSQSKVEYFQGIINSPVYDFYFETKNCNEKYCCGPTSIRIQIKGTSLIVQKIEIPYLRLEKYDSTIQDNDVFNPLVCEDFNFDGLEDFSVYNDITCNFQGNKTYYIFNKQTKEFKKDTLLTNLLKNSSDVSFSSEKKTIRVTRIKNSNYVLTAEYNDKLQKIYSIEITYSKQFASIVEKTKVGQKWYTKIQKIKKDKLIDEEL